ncbi:cell division protein FtsL [Siminovitchia terrae]|uniref:Cell division protein FtsL n=1 Tax=Siminovitchia terrae TaxID=1914933 RepID=A0A429XBL9_SIMTE|nr:cell division protein FtsL [Siminovitchia terrae]RST60845.1 cell division protein FtsL [Siminovitchia terrae]GIN91466.1 cell division protein FtsL [Siminovitchia terrae]GIN94598.1 cell division protein FtsL [Siminovitchia terrae]
MSNLAQQLQQNNSVQQKEVQKTTVRRHVKISPGEKVLYLLLAAFIIFMAVKIITVQAAVYDTNKEAQEVERNIQKHEKVNADLAMQVDELSRYERVWKKAKELGLNLNENNVKVVENR